MGWWARRRERRYAGEAARELGMVKRRCGRTEDDPKADTVGPAVVVRIREIYMQGGEDNYRIALALWQAGSALYPEHVTEGDYPRFVEYLCGRPLSEVLRPPSDMRAVGRDNPQQ